MNIIGLSGCINVVKNVCWNFIMWFLVILLGIFYEKIYLWVFYWDIKWL